MRRVFGHIEIMAHGKSVMEMFSWNNAFLIVMYEVNSLRI